MAKKSRLFKMLSVALLLPLSACAMDLGAFEKDDGYESLYKAMGDAKGIYDGGDESFDFKDSLFNDYTLEKFDWEDSDDKVTFREYTYFVLNFDDDLTIQTIAFWVRCETAMPFEMNAFYFADTSSAPTKIKYRNSPDTEDDGGEEKPIEYDDPPKENAVFSVKGSLVKEEWTSLCFEGYSQTGQDDKNLHVDDGGCLYIRIENNSGYGRDTYTAAEISFINFIIRAV